MKFFCIWIIGSQEEKL